MSIKYGKFSHKRSIQWNLHEHVATQSKGLSLFPMGHSLKHQTFYTQRNFGFIEFCVHTLIEYFWFSTPFSANFAIFWYRKILIRKKHRDLFLRRYEQWKCLISLVLLSSLDRCEIFSSKPVKAFAVTKIYIKNPIENWLLFVNGFQIAGSHNNPIK